MKQRIISALLATGLYLIIANIGNFFFGVNRRFDWTTTLWEAAFFFVFIFLLLGYRRNNRK
ncbi:hypothetical protein [Enterococcus termitis]|jgi:hypothetical protein|uniref:Uncharacterized protein n=1 Tax=Enterococcus termitis TaxID=332950 RepID=A0A1E5GJT3_9ENTE|nr:hypothetical protein [Enterococcus termitis]OEG12500.1 hypothetical protein BCR25_08165 [Enterococcus termitis]OJG96039.1 hypothetical protein RV18_GL002867 [Enterococcus termitis]